MGCDIHMRIERKIKGKWEYYPYKDEEGSEFVYITRNYDLFTILAQVRGRSGFDPCISPLRGWPDDIDERTKMLPIYPEDGEDYTFEKICEHSHSWVLLSEVLDFFNVSPIKWKKKTVQQKNRKYLIEDIDLDWLYNIIRENIDPDTRNIRLIFGFDS